MKNSRFRFIIKLIFASGIVFCAASIISVYVLSKNPAATAITAISMMSMLLLLLLLHQTDDNYITGIVSDLSRLIDTLSELQEKNIFPENEDTAISKLQTKVIKLARVLKRKNQQSIREQENIKALISDISHQLKTPLSNLIMYSEFLEDETLIDEKRKEYIHILRQAIQKLNFLSESMIKISRLESGLIHLNLQEQSLNETALKAVKDVYANAKANHTEIVWQEEQNIMLRHDRNWTAEAIFNLLDNAVKYSRPGSRVYLSVKSYEIFSAVEIKDENECIPEEERAEIFTRFYRGRNSTKKEGIGIGLYLAREIITRQGGYIKLQCTEQGNIFTIVLK